MQSIQVQSLVGELGSYMPFSVAKKTKHQNLVLLPIKRFFFNFSEPQLPHLQDVWCPLSLSHVQLFGTPWTGAHQAPLSMRILQAGILEWVAMLSSRDLLNPRIEPRSPALQAHSLPFELPEKSKNIGVGSLSLLQGIFSTQESNRSLLHCRRILYQLSYQGSPSSAGWEQCLNSHTEWLGR